MNWWLIWVGFSIVVYGQALKRGHAGAFWFFLSLVVSPLLAGVCLAMQPDLNAEVEKELN